jgi:hypothetical protein
MTVPCWQHCHYSAQVEFIEGYIMVFFKEKWLHARVLRVRFMMDAVVLGHVLLRGLQFLPVSILPPMFRAHVSFMCHRRCTRII